MLLAKRASSGSEEPNKARAVDQLWKHVRKGISGPAFLTGVPIFLEPLAKRTLNDADIVERFQVIIAGGEMGKGFSELNNTLDQRARFEQQQKMRDAGDDEAQRLDKGYIRAMEYGMPSGSIPKTNWPWPPPGHTTSGAVRTGEGNHEMPGLPYPAVRMVNAEPSRRATAASKTGCYFLSERNILLSCSA